MSIAVGYRGAVSEGAKRGRAHLEVASGNDYKDRNQMDKVWSSRSVNVPALRCSYRTDPKGCSRMHCQIQSPYTMDHQ